MPEPSATTRSELTARFLREPALAEAGNAILGAILVVMLWGRVPASGLLGWLGILISVIVAARFGIRSQFAHRSILPDRVPASLLAAVMAAGLAWGIGAYLLLDRDAANTVQLVMIVECGVAAAATSSLASFQSAGVRPVRDVAVRAADHRIDPA